MYGGYTEASGNLADLHVLDLETLTWSQPDLPPNTIPGRRSGCTLTALGKDHGVLFGGYSDSAALNDVHLCTIQGDGMAWQQVRVRVTVQDQGSGRFGLRFTVHVPLQSGLGSQQDAMAGSTSTPRQKYLPPDANESSLQQS